MLKFLIGANYFIWFMAILMILSKGYINYPIIKAFYVNGFTWILLVISFLNYFCLNRLELLKKETEQE